MLDGLVGGASHEEEEESEGREAGHHPHETEFAGGGEEESRVSRRSGANVVYLSSWLDMKEAIDRKSGTRGSLRRKTRRNQSCRGSTLGKIR